MNQNNKNAATICKSLGGPDSLEFESLPDEVVGPEEILIETKALALNFPDLLMTYGKYQFKPELPFALGMEGAGVVIGKGADAKSFDVGDHVIFKGKTGASKRYIAVSESDVSRAPNNLSFEEAASFAVTFSTAYVSLVRRGRLRAGETVLITGAGGGVGQASVAIAKALGATVIAAASDPNKLEIAAASGADHLINYQDKDWEIGVEAKTGGEGVDVILDPVGGAFLKSALVTLKPMGRALIVGFASGSFGEVDLQSVRDNGQEIIGVRAGEYGRRNPKAGQSAWDELVSLTQNHDLKPHIGKIWEERQVKDALIAMEKREVSGKQVIRLNR
ncbi:MAG: NADPH:quinone oxidoreductase family protein [Sneathiella sp.]|nr:NADPH:quinone oxidoreductase family protein [Sneathiella sp.]